MNGAARALSIALLFVCGCDAPVEPPRVAERADGWVVGNAAEAGFDPAAFERLARDIEDGEFPNTHAVLIEHDGKLVFERYFSGTDERWGEPIPSFAMGPDTLHDLRSISKSVTSLLVGIALAGDHENAVARPMAEHLPSFDLEDSHHAITLEHILTMTAGLEWNEMTVPYTDRMNDEIRMYSQDDPAFYVMTRPLVEEPGRSWYYSGGTTQVLANVIFERSGQLLGDYAHENLFEPLGIEPFEWLGPGGWTPDNPAAMSGLRLTARDLAKIGSLVLHGGRWNGKQIVPEAWVEVSTARHVPEIGPWSDGGIWGYGYQWWIGDLPGGSRVVAGYGNGNQRLFVLPNERVVVTIFAGEYNRGGGHSNRILDRVLEARRDDLEFSVSVEKTEFVSGEPVTVHFSWKNTGNDELSLREWGGPNVGVERIATVDGKPVHDFAIYRDGERLRYRGGSVDGLPGKFRLAPGEAKSRSYDVSQSYDLTAPGEYLLKAAYVRAIHAGEPERVDYVVHPDIAIVVVEGE